MKRQKPKFGNVLNVLADAGKELFSPYSAMGDEPASQVGNVLNVLVDLKADVNEIVL